MAQAPEVDRSMNLAEFLTELQTLDPAKLQARPRALNKARPKPEFGFSDVAPIPVEARTGGMTVFADDAPVTLEERGSPSGRSKRPMAVRLALLMLMLVGGGAAAAVFHSRIELLLR